MLKKLKHHQPYTILSEKEEKKLRRRLAKEEKIKKERELKKEKIKTLNYIRDYIEEKISLNELLDFFWNTPMWVHRLLNLIFNASFIRFNGNKVIYKFKVLSKKEDINVFNKIENIILYIDNNFSYYLDEIIKQDLYNAIKKWEYYLIEYIKISKQKPREYKPWYIKIIYNRNW